MSIVKRKTVLDVGDSLTGVGDKNISATSLGGWRSFLPFSSPTFNINKYEHLVATFQECHQHNNSVTDSLKLSSHHAVANTVVAFLGPLALQTRLGVGFHETPEPSFQAVASDILFRVV